MARMVKIGLSLLGCTALVATSCKKPLPAKESVSSAPNSDEELPDPKPASPTAESDSPASPTAESDSPAQEFITGCYSIKVSGTKGPSVRLRLQATGTGSFLLSDADGKLLQASPLSIEKTTYAGPLTEYVITPGIYPKFEAKTSTDKWLTLSENEFSFAKTKSALVADPSEGCIDAEGDIATDAVPEKALVGIADLHSHPFADEGFGGKLLQGKSFSPYGASVGLKTCEADHGKGGLKDIVGNALDAQLGHETSGFPDFKGWPSAFDSNHQQMYYRWIERAYRGGLRLMVAHAVNSQALCSVIGKIETYSCEDMPAADRQIDLAFKLEAYIDAQFGGRGKGWLRIVKSPAEARTAIRSGKLAMVLGIEVDALFGCRTGKCTSESVLSALDTYYARGVRQLFPIHVTDNAFGGAALYTPLVFNLANKILSGEYFKVNDCGKDGVTYQEVSVGDSALIKALLPEKYVPPAYTKSRGHCNPRGLTELGQTLIKGLMKRGMLIDIDHMSARTLNDVLTVAEKNSYPLVAGHTGFIDTSAIGQKRSEAQKSDTQLRRLVRLGGMVGPILHQGKAHDEVLPSGPVANDCDSSSKAWAQAYSYALSVFREEGKTPALAYGSDFNGLVHLPSPRFGKSACDGNKKQAALQKERLKYPFASKLVKGTFNKMRAGDRIYDYNEDGFAQIGLFPEFIQDLSVIGLSEEDLHPLYHSAEAYVRMWEKAEAAGEDVDL